MANTVDAELQKKLYDYLLRMSQESEMVTEENEAWLNTSKIELIFILQF